METTQTAIRQSIDPVTSERVRSRRTHRSVFTVRESLRHLADHSPGAAIPGPGFGNDRVRHTVSPTAWDPNCSTPGYRLLLSALHSMTHALQNRDPYMAGHSMRVSAFARGIAQEMKLPAEWVRQIGFAGELHDIGKIRIPEELLNKADVLTDEEHEQVMQHTVIGEEIVSSLPLKDPTLRHVVRWHHERVDGRGGPDGLAGDRIPLAARIVSVADAFDAMTSVRPYRPAMSVELALYEIRTKAGQQFDPRCVDALEAILRQTQRALTLHRTVQDASGRTSCAA